MTRRSGTTRRTLLAAFAGGVLGLAGCGYRAGGGELRWRSSTFHAADEVVFDGGTLLLVTREAMTFDFESERWADGGYVVTLDPERGERTGEYGFEAPVLTAAIGHDSVYVGRTDGAVSTTRIWIGRESGASGESDAGTPTPDPDGWTTATGVGSSGIGALAVGSEGSVYGGGSGGLAALSSDGRVRWRWREGTVVEAVRGEGRTAVYALTPDRLIALAGDGSVRWTRETTPTDAEQDRPVPPLVDRNGLYLADGDGMIALGHEGSVRWKRDVGDPVGRPALTDEGVYHATANGVRAFSLDGRERWSHDPRGPVRSRVAAADGRAFVLAGESLVAVGAAGTAWRVPLDEPEPFAPEFGPFVAGETLVLGGPREVRGYWRSQLRRE